ncbi:hypothetical protein C8F04DRAFT_1092431 [Mycena alexandri]|uniref:Uncharacterized protein n=1 Tax=Mycena alexandri TaxID=1745969 RepID=A0AAD6X6M6_9AGAR|nr:hypothetical protein C8F04DRAFT_1092431 [Mycena alexandri]
MPFFKSIRQLCVGLASASLSLFVVTSPSAIPAILSPGSDILDTQWSVTSYGPVFRTTTNTTTTNPASIIAPAIEFDAPSIVFVNQPQTLSLFDFGELDMDAVEAVVPSLYAFARILHKNPGDVGDAIVIEVMKTLLVESGLRMQVPLGLGEELERVDGVLSAMIFRMAFDLVLGALVVLIRWGRKAPLKIAKFLACIARDLDLWFGSQIYSVMVIVIPACNFRSAMLEFVSNSVIATYLLDSVYNLLARPPRPPPPPVFVNCKGHNQITHFIHSLAREVDFWLAAEFYSAATIIVFSVGMLPTISNFISDLIIVAYLDYFLYHLCVHSPPPPPPPPGRKKKRWYHHH